MDSQVAVLGIFVNNIDSVPKLNETLSEYGDYIMGRMGVPYHDRRVNVISIAVEAPSGIINELSNKIGNIDGINSNAIYNN